MSEPVAFPQANHMYGSAPNTSEDKRYKDLPTFSDGTVHISKWKFTPEELEELKKNDGCCYVLIIGKAQPPIKISPIDPFASTTSQTNA